MNCSIYPSCSNMRHAFFGDMPAFLVVTTLEDGDQAFGRTNSGTRCRSVKRRGLILLLVLGNGDDRVLLTCYYSWFYFTPSMISWKCQPGIIICALPLSSFPPRLWATSHQPPHR